MSTVNNYFILFLFYQVQVDVMVSMQQNSGTTAASSRQTRTSKDRDEVTNIQFRYSEKKSDTVQATPASHRIIMNTSTHNGQTHANIDLIAVGMAMSGTEGEALVRYAGSSAKDKTKTIITTNILKTSMIVQNCHDRRVLSKDEKKIESKTVYPGYESTITNSEENIT